MRIGPKTEQVDVVVARWKWELEVIRRAEPMPVETLQLRVPLTSDLILLKLAAGGYKDLVDAYNLLKIGPREQLIAEVDSHIGDLRPEAQAEWQKLRAAV